MIVHFPLGVLVSLCLGCIIVYCDDTADIGPSGYGDRVDPALIEKLVRRVEGLEKQAEKQAEANRELTEANRKQAETNRKQADAIEGLEKQVQQHENVIHEQAGVIKKLQLRLDTVEEELATLKTSHAFADDTSKDQDTGDLPTNPNDRAQPTKRGFSQPGSVAFTAYLTHTVSHLGIDSPIVFNEVLLNQGGAYNQYTGIFTCPVDGIYVFNFVLETWNVMQIVAKLVVDNVNQVDGIADTMHVNHEAQGGNYATLSLRAGQSVWVANYRWADKEELGTDINRFVTFSGHLVSPTGALAIQG